MDYCPTAESAVSILEGIKYAKHENNSSNNLLGKMLLDSGLHLAIF